jgi:ribosome-associated protein
VQRVRALRKRNPPHPGGKRHDRRDDLDYVAPVQITPELSIAESELSYRATRAGGPGGQHVNTSSTRVELWWNLATSPSLSQQQREWLSHRLAARVDAEGWIRLVSSGSRSQLQNRKEVTERFRTLLTQAIVVPKPRKKTRPTRAARERRLADKKKTSVKKQQRRKPAEE